MSPYIKILDVFYGGNCNLACHQCETRSDVHDDTNTDPDLDNIIEGLRLAKDRFEIDIYGLIGGDPLLYLDRIERIAQAIREQDPDKVLLCTTNGLLLDKKSDDIARLIQKYDISFCISNHFASFVDTSLKDKIKKDYEELAGKLGFVRQSDDSLFRQIFLDSRSDPTADFWKKLFDDQSTEDWQILYKREKTFLYYNNQAEFKRNHRIDAQGKPKPFATNDPERSYREGCSGPLCSLLMGTKLYKCSALATLRKMLKHHDSLDDPDWQKYLNYEPVDLLSSTAERVQNFSDTKFCAIDQCDMCSTGDDVWFVKTPDKVLKIKRV